MTTHPVSAQPFKPRASVYWLVGAFALLGYILSPPFVIAVTSWLSLRLGSAWNVDRQVDLFYAPLDAWEVRSPQTFPDCLAAYYEFGTEQLLELLLNV